MVGEPVCRGTQITVDSIVKRLRIFASPESMLQTHPQLTHAVWWSIVVFRVRPTDRRPGR
ncbi:MAG: DUF433 domain-containing protein [Dehalococcoidia bacterium]